MKNVFTVVPNFFFFIKILLIFRCTSKVENECFYEQVSAFLLPPVKSAKMKSLINFKYGKIEIQAKLPAGDWIVPGL